MKKMRYYINDIYEFRVLLQCNRKLLLMIIDKYKERYFLGSNNMYISDYYIRNDIINEKFLVQIEDSILKKIESDNVEVLETCNIEEAI